MKNVNELLTTRQVAEQLNVKEATIRKFISLGRLKSTKIGSMNFIDPADLEDFERKRIPKPRKATKGSRGNESK